MKARSLRFGIVAALLVVTALSLHVHPQNPPPYLCSLPAQIDDWTGTGLVLDQQTREILRPGEFLIRDYQNASQPRIDLMIAYYPVRKADDIDFENRLRHSPVPISPEIVQITRPDGSSFPVNRSVISIWGRRQLVLFWFQAHGRAVASENWAKYYLVYDLVRTNRSDGAIVRLGTPMLDGESPEGAQTRMMKLGSQFLPLLDRCIPQ